MSRMKFFIGLEIVVTADAYISEFSKLHRGCYSSVNPVNSQTCNVSLSADRLDIPVA